jgi:four helix bundle protein
MTRIKEFEDLKVWNMSRELCNEIYKITLVGGFRNDFALRDQIRRAAISIMSNIAEGFESQTQSLFITYLARSKASAGEVRSQLYLASDLGYLEKEKFETLMNKTKHISRSLFKFIHYLRSQPNLNRY